MGTIIKQIIAARASTSKSAAVQAIAAEAITEQAAAVPYGKGRSEVDELAALVPFASA